MMTIKLMIVDDSLFMRNMLRGILESDGYQIVAEAADGVEAVAKYLEFRPEITTMDIIMPVKNGIEALSEIISLDAGAKVVMCSAIGQESLIQTAHTAGAKDYLLKPFKPERVKEVIKRVAGA
jgi:two-component system, chemotaxis family, chemotaxis protein CheY